MKRTDLAYIAGLIDGEGCISANHRGLTKDGLQFYNIYIQIVMTDRGPLELMEALYGGKIYARQSSKRKYGNYKMPYHWQVCGEKAYKLLMDIKPYLIAKRPQAEVAFRILKVHPRWRRYTPMERFLQEIDAKELHDLKT